MCGPGERGHLEGNAFCIRCNKKLPVWRMEWADHSFTKIEKEGWVCKNCYKIIKSEKKNQEVKNFYQQLQQR